MTPQERQLLKKLFVATSLYYGQSIPDEALQLYVQDLDDLPFEKVSAVLTEIRRDTKTTRCPLPAHVRQRLNPEPDPEAEAIEASSRIVEAMSKIGPYRPKEAQMFIGELGWLVVQREGGWARLCESVTDDNLPILRAQWRQIAHAQFKRAKAGLSEAPALPGEGGKVIGIDMKKLLPEMPRAKEEE